MPVLLQFLLRRRLQLRRRVDASSSVTPCSVNAGGFVGNGCVGHACSPLTSLAGTARSSIGHTGVPVTRSKTNAKPCLVS